MRTHTGVHPVGMARARKRLLVEAAAFIVCAMLTAWSAVVVKERGLNGRPLVAVSTTALPEAAEVRDAVIMKTAAIAPTGIVAAQPIAPVIELPGSEVTEETRWFDARPVRPVRTIWMKVTGYSPDHRSCGKFADGKTATLHSVYTNAMQLVAADPRVLPEGALISVPGYAGADIVPVLDVGGAIKGNRLDLLFATHEEARQWGVREIAVTVWAYDDGQPATCPRKAR